MPSNNTDTVHSFIDAIQSEDINKLNELHTSQSFDIDRFIFGDGEYNHNVLTYAIANRCQQSVQWLIEKKVDVNCTKHVSDGTITISPLALAIFALELCSHKSLSTKLSTLLLSADQQPINQSIIQESINNYKENIPAINHDDASITIISMLISVEDIQNNHLRQCNHLIIFCANYLFYLIQNNPLHFQEEFGHP